MADQVVARDESQSHSLPRWREWSSVVVREDCDPNVLGFICGHAALNRAAARYRVARSFGGVVLERFAVPTAEGYSALFRLFLAWTAFEQYYKALGLTSQTRDAWFAKYAPEDADTRIRSMDPNNCLFHLVLNKTRRDVEANVAAYVKRQPYGLTYLAAAVRHVFAHGILTPHANKASPIDVANLTNYLATLLLDAMALDFEARVASLPRTFPDDRRS